VPIEFCLENSSLLLECLQIEPRSLTTLITFFAIFPQRLVDDAHQLGRNAAATRASGGGSVLGIAASVSLGVSPSNGFATRQHFVNHCAETEDVRTVIDTETARLFGRHVPAVPITMPEPVRT
jgi:hypothetical protein